MIIGKQSSVCLPSPWTPTSSGRVTTTALPNAPPSTKLVMKRQLRLLPTLVATLEEPNDDAIPARTTRTKPRASLYHELSHILDLGPWALYSKSIQKGITFSTKKEIMHNYSLGRVWVWGTAGHRGELSGLIWDFMF